MPGFVAGTDDDLGELTGAAAQVTDAASIDTPLPQPKAFVPARTGLEPGEGPDLGRDPSSENHLLAQPETEAPFLP